MPPLRIRPCALGLALASLLPMVPASADLLAFPLDIQTGLAATSFDGGLANPAVAGAYLGTASPEKLAAALAGLHSLLAKLPLITPPGPCWHCGFGSSTITWTWTTGDPVEHIDVLDVLPAPWLTLITAASDADLGAPGAAVTLAYARLELAGSFETGRDFIIGHPAYPPNYSPSGLFTFLPEDAEPPPAGGPGWIDSRGHDLKITGTVTSYQKLWKDGEGSLWLTGVNRWHAVPEVKAGALKGDSASLATDIVNHGRVSFAQVVDGSYPHVISGTGGLEKTGAGVLTFSQTQTYTGPTRILEGTLALDGGRIESSTDVELALGATLDASRVPEVGLNNLSGQGRVRIGEARLNLYNNTETSFAGQIEGPGELLVRGTAILRLTGVNAHLGGTRIEGGRLAIGSDASLGAAAAPVTIHDGGRLILLADLTTARTLRAGHGMSVLDTAGYDLILLSPLEGHGQVLIKQSAGTLYVTTATPFSGAVTVAEGTLSLLGAGALNPASHVRVEFGVLDQSGADGGRQLRSISGYDSAEIRLGGNTLTLTGGGGVFHGAISGYGGLTLDDSHLTLTGANSYTGPTTILAGTLRARPQSLSDQVVNHGRLELFDYGELDAISAYSGDIGGGGQLVKTDKSVIWLRGHNTYTGGTLVEAGVLMGNTDSLPGDIETRAGLAFYQVADGTYSGRVSGTGTLMSFGPGALTLTGDNSHTGGTAFSNTLRIHRDANLGDPAADLLIVGGTLVALDDLALNRRIVLASTGARFDSNGHDIRIDGRIEGPGGLTKAGAGTLYLTGGIGGYLGPTLVEAGGLVVNGSLVGDVDIMPGAWLELANHDGGLFINVNIRFVPRGPDDLMQVGGDQIREGGTLILRGASTLRIQQVGRGLRIVAAPVPEPETWAMLLLGLGLVGLLARRRLG